MLGNLSSLASAAPAVRLGDLVSKFLPMVFGSSQDQVTSAISQQSGLGGASVTGLLKLAVPLVLGFIGKAHAKARSMPARSAACSRLKRPGCKATCLQG